MVTDVLFSAVRWSEALHGVAGSPGVHFGGKVTFHHQQATAIHTTVSADPHAQQNLSYTPLLTQVPNATSFPQVIGIGATFNR